MLIIRLRLCKQKTNRPYESVPYPSVYATVTLKMIDQNSTDTRVQIVVRALNRAQSLELGLFWVHLRLRKFGFVRVRVWTLSKSLLLVSAEMCSQNTRPVLT